jgi:hypothetical protein
VACHRARGKAIVLTMILFLGEVVEEVRLQIRST